MGGKDFAAIFFDLKSFLFYFVNEIICYLHIMYSIKSKNLAYESFVFNLSLLQAPFVDLNTKFFIYIMFITYRRAFPTFMKTHTQLGTFP